MQKPATTAADCPANSEDLIAPLRAEIVESQKARIDLLKYKLIAIAALGSIGLGLSGDKGHPGASGNLFILTLIPLVCLYVDLLCYHNTMRILVIGQFFMRHGCPYENFIAAANDILAHDKIRGGYLFELEDVALQWSSLVLSLLLIPIGAVNDNRTLLLFGIVGAGASYGFHLWFEDHKKKLFAIAPNIGLKA